MINIHNGDSVLLSAKRAGIAGDHMAFRESLISGPVPADGDWKETRARFLSAESGEELLRTSNNIFEQEQALTDAQSKDEVVLWFEHDLFCLVHFLYLLKRLRGANVSYVWSSEPLAMREPADLQTLFESRTAATPALFDVAVRAWGAYTSPDPRALNAFIAAGSPELPFLREGLRLHASRFPSTRNGLGAVENQLLKLISGGATDFGLLFPLVDANPPRFGFGDTQILSTLRRMASRAVPLITLVEATEPPSPPKATFAVTPAGENVMNGTVDDTVVNEPDFWLGGVHVTKENVWRWDESRGEIVSSRPAGS